MLDFLRGTVPLVACQGKEPHESWSEITQPRQELPLASDYAIHLRPAGLVAIDVDFLLLGEERKIHPLERITIDCPTAWHRTPRGWRAYYKAPEEAKDLPDRLVLYEDRHIRIELLQGLALIPTPQNTGLFSYAWRRFQWPPPELPSWVIPEAQQRKKVSSQSIPTTVDLLQGREELVMLLMRKAGRTYKGLGKGFHCILHPPDHHPSASWVKNKLGSFVYRDWHARDSLVRLSPAEVSYALRTGHLKRLKPDETRKELTLLLREERELSAKFQELVAFVLERNTALIEETLLYNYSTDRKSSCNRRGSGEVVREIWSFLCEAFTQAAKEGQFLVMASSRFMAKKMGCSALTANRALNLLAALGFLVRATNLEREKAKGCQWLLACPAKEEVERRWEALGRPSLSEFSLRLVEERLGSLGALRGRPLHPPDGRDGLGMADVQPEKNIVDPLPRDPHLLRRRGQGVPGPEELQNLPFRGKKPSRQRRRRKNRDLLPRHHHAPEELRPSDGLVQDLAGNPQLLTELRPCVLPRRKRQQLRRRPRDSTPPGPGTSDTCGSHRASPPSSACPKQKETLGHLRPQRSSFFALSTAVRLG